MSDKWFKLIYKCNNPNCKFETIFIYKDQSHLSLPDTDCPECRWHDSVIEEWSELD